MERDHCTSSSWQPNSRYAHVFVVVRCLNRAAFEDATQDDIALTRAYVSEEEAEREAARLNALNEQHWSYFVRVARLVPPAEGKPGAPAPALPPSALDE